MPGRSPQTRLVAAGFDDRGGGGIAVIRDTGIDHLDRLATTGIAVHPSGELLARLLWSDTDPQVSGAVLLYDRRGLRLFARIDELQDPHGALWDRDDLLIVSTQRNSVLRLDRDARIVDRHAFTGDGDAWHLNTLSSTPNGIVVSGFARTPNHRDWSLDGALDGAGFVADLQTGTPVLTGLSAPHDPVQLEDGWLVCDSARGHLVALRQDGTERVRRALGGWTRGVARDGDLVHIGVTPERAAGAQGHAWVTTCHLAELVIVDRRELPLRQVFSLAIMDDGLIEAVRTSAEAGPWWSALPADAEARPARPVEPSPWSYGTGNDLEVRLRDGIPRRVPAARWLRIGLSAKNLGESVVRHAGTQTILIGARWETPSGTSTGHEARAGLHHPLLPGESAELTLRIAAPPIPGPYVFRVAAHRPGCPWFDTVNPELGVQTPLVQVY